MSAQPFLRYLFRENVVLLVVAMLVVVPLLAPFTDGIPGRALRNGLFESIGVLLLIALLARVEFQGGLPRFLALARSGVNAPLAFFMLWAAVRALWVPDRVFAISELLRLGSGALVYFVVALHLETRAQLRLLADCLLGVMLLLLGYGFVSQGSEAASGFAAVFPNRHDLSAVLIVLLPLFASLALGLQDRGRRLVAIAAAILCAAGLFLTLERSAWIAAGVGLLVWLSLSGRSAERRKQNWRAALAVAACALLVAVGFFAATGVTAAVVNRAGEIATAAQGQDRSLAWRVQKWRGTAAMAMHKPVWGWGPGQYVLYQYPYTHLCSYPGNTPRGVREEIRRFGAGFEDMAYNEYLQTAAELGLTGLALYLLVLLSFFSKAGRALGRLPDGLRRTTLLGCMAGVAAQMVDAMANGSWRYNQCSIFFWLILGLGTAVTRMAYQAAGSPHRLDGFLKGGGS
jgi:O-antigen ligase